MGVAITSGPDDVVLAALERAAEAGEICPTCDDLLDVLHSAGCPRSSVATTVNIVARLERQGVIRVERYQKSRRVWIVGTGKSTAEPDNKSPHWRHRPPPADLPVVAPASVVADNPRVGETILNTAAKMGIAPAEYLKHLIWVGWNVEQGNG